MWSGYDCDDAIVSVNESAVVVVVVVGVGGEGYVVYLCLRVEY